MRYYSLHARYGHDGSTDRMMELTERRSVNSHCQPPRRQIQPYQAPANILIGIEIFLLFCFLVDVTVKGYLAGAREVSDIRLPCHESMTLTKDSI